MKTASLALSLSMALMLPAMALAEKGDKGPGDRAYERASENASFKREDGKPDMGETGKQKGHSRDGENHEHDDQDSDAEGRKNRRTEQEQEQVRDRDREQERIQEKVQSEQRREKKATGGN
jgi:hypothetical protein